jgi:hypothetical protein
MKTDHKIPMNVHVLSSNRGPRYYDNATMRTLRQSFVLTPAMNVPVDPSVQQPTTNFTYEIKSINAYVQNMLHHTLLITNMFPSFCDLARSCFI